MSDIRFPETGTMDDCGLPRGYLELNLDPLQEQVLLTTEPSLYPTLDLVYLHFWINIRLCGQGIDVVVLK